MLSGGMKTLGRSLVGRNGQSDGLVALVVYLVSLLLILLFGKYLWNNVLVKLVPVVRPVNSVLEILGLHILFSLLFAYIKYYLNI